MKYFYGNLRAWLLKILPAPMKNPQIKGRWVYKLFLINPASSRISHSRLGILAQPGSLPIKHYRSKSRGKGKQSNPGLVIHLFHYLAGGECKDFHFHGSNLLRLRGEQSLSLLQKVKQMILRPIRVIIGLSFIALIMGVRTHF